MPVLAIAAKQPWHVPPGKKAEIHISTTLGKGGAPLQLQKLHFICQTQCLLEYS